jgi:hypothetical protein
VGDGAERAGGIGGETKARKPLGKEEELRAFKVH